VKKLTVIQKRSVSSVPERAKFALANLIVSPDRTKWILERYPENEYGRPGVLHVEAARRADERIKRRDPVRPGIVVAGEGEEEEAA
jgi:hypothetical protein